MTPASTWRGLQQIRQNGQLVPPAVLDGEINKKLIDRGTKEKDDDGKDTEEVNRGDWFIDTFLMIAPDVERRPIRTR